MTAIQHEKTETAVDPAEGTRTFTAGDLLRRGIQLTPNQSKGFLYIPEEEASCAIGAMSLAAVEMGLGK